MENRPVQSDQIDERTSQIPNKQQNLNDGYIKSDNNREGSLNNFIDVMNVESANDPVTGKIRSQYAIRKTTALGMMDLALLTANANQLRFLITYNTASPTYYFTMFLIILSLLLQICVGIALIFKQQMKKSGNDAHLNTTNNLLTVGIFLITVINVFVASFTMTESKFV